MTSTSPSPVLTEDAIREFSRRYLHAWNSHDSARIEPLVTDDVVWADPALPEPAVGIPALREFMEDAWRAFPDLRFEEPDPPYVSVSGDQVAWAWRMHGRMLGEIDPPGFAPTGRRMELDGVDLWVMREGRIARYRAFYDMMDLARQLGIMPPPGSGAERASVRLQRVQARFIRRR